MATSEQFTATGSTTGVTLVGFQTRPNVFFERGVDARGTDVGVVAKATGGIGVHAQGTTAVQADGGEIGVRCKGHRSGVVAEADGTGSIGVDSNGRIAGLKGEGLTGVIALGSKTGLFASGGKIGVASKGPVGVQGTGTPGGEFISRDKHAQLRLVPHTITAGTSVPITPPIRVFTPAGDQLPSKGQLGDLWLTKHAKGQTRCILWLCVVGHTNSARAKWAQVLLGPSIEGTTTPGTEPGGKESEES